MSAGVCIRQGQRATQASCPHACAGRHVPRPRQLKQHVGVHVLRAAGEPLTGPVRRECRMPASRTSVPRASRTAGTTSGRPHGRAVAHRGRGGSARPMIGPTRSPAAFGIASTSTSVSILTRLHATSNSSSGIVVRVLRQGVAEPIDFHEYRCALAVEHTAGSSANSSTFLSATGSIERDDTVATIPPCGATGCMRDAAYTSGRYRIDCVTHRHWLKIVGRHPTTIPRLQRQ